MVKIHSIDLPPATEDSTVVAALLGAVNVLAPAVDPARIMVPLRRLLAELLGAVETPAEEMPAMGPGIDSSEPPNRP